MLFYFHRCCRVTFSNVHIEADRKTKDDLPKCKPEKMRAKQKMSVPNEHTDKDFYLAFILGEVL